MRLAPLGPLFLILLLAFSVLSLAVLGGGARAIFSRPLVADIAIHDLVLPIGDISLDSAELASALSEEILLRAENDVATRATLDPRARQDLIEALLPRIVDVSAIRGTLNRIPSVGVLSSLGSYRAIANITVENRSGGTLEDVALTLPAMIQAQDAEGNELEVISGQAIVNAVRIGALGPGETRKITAWMGNPADSVAALSSRIRIGAAGVDGDVYVQDGTPGAGTDFEATPWVRWIVSGTLLITALGSLTALMAMVLSAWRSRRATPQSRLTSRIAPTSGS